MFDTIPFERIDGEPPARELTLFTLSTCAFCEQARTFLNGRKCAFRRIVVDELPKELKRSLRNEFVRRFGMSLVFPTLLVGEAEVVAGFEAGKWRELLRTVCPRPSSGGTRSPRTGTQ